MTLADFAEAAATYCFETGGSVTSWVRSPARNVAVGGHKRSRHLVGLAVDVVYHPNQRPGAVEAHAHALGLWLLAEGDHDHLEPLDLHPSARTA